MVRKHREIVAHADLRDDKELMAIIDARIEAENIPLPPEFGLAELAELVGVTQTRLKDLFRKSTIYRTADKYLDNLRLLRALSLLRKHPEYSIEAISQEAGFASVRTLNRKIQETIGLTPGIYRDICNPSDD
jgi:transcriptional regulator GlxA family with amidase domain